MGIFLGLEWMGCVWSVNCVELAMGDQIFLVLDWVGNFYLGCVYAAALL